MNTILTFINILANIDLNLPYRDNLNKIYDELETLDVDLETSKLKANNKRSYTVNDEIISLIEFYYANADDCINNYSDNKARNFLKSLKEESNKIISYLVKN